MNVPRPTVRPWRRLLTAGVAGVSALALIAACTAEEDSSAGGSTSAEGGLFDDTLVHDIDVSFDQADYDAMIETFRETGDKEWISATVTIDGTVVEEAGIRLKGNSSLRGLSGSARAGAAGAADEDRATGAAAEDAAAGTEDVPDDAGTAPDQDAGAADADAGGRGGAWAGAAGDADAETPEELPWLVRLDKFVDGQEYRGYTEFVVRSNTSETSLNEAVALDLLEAAGLATQRSFATRFSVNDGEELLRLVVENPDETWEAENFSTDGVLYKAESDGDYSYRGDDPASYVDVFDQETGTEDLTPLIGFLDFINSADDESFAAELDEHLDVDAFATYLAVQELIANEDDIDGPGNNSYLRYDAESERFTVVAWDHNLAFGGMGGAGMGGFGAGGGRSGAGGPAAGEGRGGRPAQGDGGQAGAPGEGRTPPEGFEPPEGFTPPEGFEPPEGFTPPEGFQPGEGMTPPEGGGRTGGGGFGGRSNVLVERFLADDAFGALYQERLDELTQELYGDGIAQQILSRWTELLTDQASDLVDADTIAAEAARIEAFFEVDAADPSPSASAAE